MLESPDLSVIIPTYNRLPLLQETLDSFVGKLSCTYEVIVVDDGSTDGTRDFLRSVPAPVRPIFNEHQGVQVARNAGMAETQGRYIKFLDDDDLLYPQAVDSQVAFLLDNPLVDVVYSEFDYWNTTKGAELKPSSNGSYDDLVDAMLSNWSGPPFCFLWRHAFVKDIPWNLEIKHGLEDAEFLIRAGLSWPAIKYLPLQVGKYRRHSTQTVSTKPHYHQRAKTWLQIWDYLEGALYEAGELNDHRRALLAKHYYVLAEGLYPYEREIYRKYVKKALELVPSYIPPRPRFRLLVKLFGHEMAQHIRQRVLGQRHTP